ncbi:alpha/beta fold hydrolase [Pseudonocardia nigra]|uniref:alpha/beta fold hydrolase n=1 Tax=Pseudonocardia nigra TaxID=1921578 RepID=UPI001C5E4895|nr:alpha/beta hydrolase [Pseudonocardia nigra]
MHIVTSPDGTPIAVDRVGEGPAVVLVGGAFQHRAIDEPTARLAALLGERFTVHHYDRRGRGDSGDTAPYAPEREVEDLAAVIEAAGGSARVFAMSSGGALALDAARAGLPIRKLALYEPPFIVDASRPPVPADYREHLTALAAGGRHGEAVEYFLTRAVGLPAEMVAGMRQAPIWPVFEKVAPTLAYDAAFVAEHMAGSAEPLRRWTGVEVPALVVTGGASPEHFHTGADALAAVLPGAQRRTLPGQTHEVDPEQLAPVLSEFFH